MKTKTPEDVSQRLLSRSQLADTCKVSLPTIDNWVRRGLPFEVRNGKKLFRFGKAIVWRAFHDLRVNDHEFSERMKQPLRRVLDSFTRAHCEVLGSITLNDHPRADEISEKLREISGLVADIYDVA